MSKVIRIILLVAVGTMAFLYWNGRAPAEEQAITNGSFETGDYSGGWNLSEERHPDDPRPDGEIDEANGADGTWAIVESGKVIEGDIKDCHDQIEVPQSCPPVSFIATDGIYMAVELQNNMHIARLSQDITLPADATALSWDMAYINMAGAFSTNHFLAVYFRDVLTDEILETLYFTDWTENPPNVYGKEPVYQNPGSEWPTQLTLQPIPEPKDISQYAGKTVRLDVTLSIAGYLPVALDNFRVETTAVETSPPVILPPGWAMGEKTIWEGATPPGLEKQVKTPPGHVNGKGNKTGWTKEK